MLSFGCDLNSNTLWRSICQLFEDTYHADFFCCKDHLLKPSSTQTRPPTILVWSSLNITTYLHQHPPSGVELQPKMIDYIELIWTCSNEASTSTKRSICFTWSTFVELLLLINFTSTASIEFNYIYFFSSNAIDIIADIHCADIMKARWFRCDKLGIWDKGDNGW